MAERYMLITENHPATLATRVSDMLDQGWKLYGNPVMTAVVDTGGDWPRIVWAYAQAMVTNVEVA